MKALLRIKHWQIFLLVVGTALFVQLIQNLVYLASGAQEQVPQVNYLGLILLIPLSIYFLWIAAVGIKFSKSGFSPPMKTRSFLVSLGLAFFSHFFLFFYFWYYPQYLNRAGEEEVISITIIAFFVFIAFLTLFYCLSFMAKAIVQAERTRKINSSEYFSEFVMAVMFPIGIWLLQPRINQLDKKLG